MPATARIRTQRARAAGAEDARRKVIRGAYRSPALAVAQTVETYRGRMMVKLGLENLAGGNKVSAIKQASSRSSSPASGNPRHRWIGEG